MKRCSSCKKYKHNNEFHKSTINKDGLQNRCKQCDKEYHRCYDSSAYQKKYRADHKSELRDKRKWSRYYEKLRLKDRDLHEDFSPEELKAKVMATNGICPRCKRPYDNGHGLTINHTPDIVNAPVGFHYTIDDVEPMCKSCNVSIYASANVLYVKKIFPKQIHVSQKTLFG